MTQPKLKSPAKKALEEARAQAEKAYDEAIAPAGKIVEFISTSREGVPRV